MDHIAIPDFAAGAMENWGAITYREIAILVDPENTSAGTKQIVASIVSHEMAHQWFGNLVTMAWWGCPLAERELRLVDGGHGGRPSLP